MYRFLIVLACSFFCLSVSACQQQPTSAIFQNVEAAEKWLDADQIVKIYDPEAEIPVYLIQQNSLYLLIQTTQPQVINNKIYQHEWGRTEIDNLTKELPEFERSILESPWLVK